MKDKMVKIAETFKEWAPTITCVVVLVASITYLVNRAATLDAHIERMKERTSEMVDGLDAFDDELHKMVLDQAVMDARMSTLARDVEDLKRKVGVRSPD